MSHWDVDCRLDPQHGQLEHIHFLLLFRVWLEQARSSNKARFEPFHEDLCYSPISVHVSRFLSLSPVNSYIFDCLAQFFTEVTKEVILLCFYQTLFEKHVIDGRWGPILGPRSSSMPPG
jgi:hypothetical protein